MFSDKYANKERQIIQIDSISEKLKIDIWNSIQKYYIDSVYYESSYSDERVLYANIELFKCNNYKLLVDLYENFFIFPVYDMRASSMEKIKNTIEKSYCELEWYRVYDFIEYVNSKIEFENFKCEINIKLERNNSAYRLIENKICPITNDLEITSIEKASKTMYDTVNSHIDKAIQLFSNKHNPDFENTIKESIIAIETLCSIIVGKNSSLGDALKKLEDSGIYIHPSLKASFSKLYGYSSDANGIRHAGDIGGMNSTFAEAKFMLVSCSAFVNYLIDNYANIIKK